MEHTMKCDYCKIHYAESEGVCPNCGMTPRKRSIKILCAVAEVIFWMIWIFIIPYAYLEVKIGHPLIAVAAVILALPSVYYLFRRFVGRKHCKILAGIRAGMLHWFDRKIPDFRKPCEADGREPFERCFCA